MIETKYFKAPTKVALLSYGAGAGLLGETIIDLKQRFGATSFEAVLFSMSYHNKDGVFFSPFSEVLIYT